MTYVEKKANELMHKYNLVLQQHILEDIETIILDTKRGVIKTIKELIETGTYLGVGIWNEALEVACETIKETKPEEER